MCWFRISEPCKTLISWNGIALLETDTTSREDAALLSCLSSEASFKQECLWNQAFSLFPEILSFNVMRDVHACVFSFILFHFPVLKYLFAFIRWKSRNDQWASHCWSLRRDEEWAGLAESLTCNTKEETRPRAGLPRAHPLSRLLLTLLIAHWLHFKDSVHQSGPQEKLN